MRRLAKLIALTITASLAAVLLVNLASSRGLVTQPGLAELLRPALPSGSRAPGVQVRVGEVLSTGARGLNAVLLVPEGEDRVLPIFVEADEASLIQRRIAEADSEPTGGDVLGLAISSLGGTLDRVVIEDAEPLATRGRLYVSQGHRSIDLPAPGADSIAVALSGHAPIYVSPDLLRDAGLSRQQFEALREGQAENEPSSPDEVEPRGRGGSGSGGVSL